MGIFLENELSLAFQGNNLNICSRFELSNQIKHWKHYELESFCESINPDEISGDINKCDIFAIVKLNASKT